MSRPTGQPFPVLGRLALLAAIGVAALVVTAPAHAAAMPAARQQLQAKYPELKGLS